MITLRRGTILWHARWQPRNRPNARNVMSSPDYLYASPQIQQALYHGYQTYKEDTLIQLTKLRVTKPLHLINFKSANNQRNMANVAGINFEPFYEDDILLIKEICKISDPDAAVDGYRAVWDQDQVAICGRVIRDKLEVVETRYFDPDQYYVRANFVRYGRSAYYKAGKAGKNLIRSIRAGEKRKALTKKALRIEEIRSKTTPSMRIIKKMVKKVAPKK